MLGKLSVVALTATTLMVLAPAYAQRGGGEGGGAGGPPRAAHQLAEVGHQLQPQPRVVAAVRHQLQPQPRVAGGASTPAGAPAAGGGRGGPAAAGGGGLHLVAMAAMRTETPMTAGSISKSGGPLSGGAITGGIRYGEKRRFWRGRWYEYGVGRCWLDSPIGFVWVCGG